MRTKAEYEASIITPEIEQAYQKAMAADVLFQAAVVLQFGKRNAGTKRYCTQEFNADTMAAAESYWQACHVLLDAKDYDRKAVGRG